MKKRNNTINMQNFRPGDDSPSNTTDKYLSVGGEGYNYHNDLGEFEVRSDTGTAKFDKADDAIEFFNHLDEAASLWNCLDLIDTKEQNPNYKTE